MNPTNPTIGVIVLILTAIAALYVFIKIEHFLIRLAGGFFGLVLIAVGIWWFFLRH